MKSTLFLISWTLLFASCWSQKNIDSEDDTANLGIVPWMSIDKDTVFLGDSVSGQLGITFTKELGVDQRRLVLENLRYSVDTVDLDITNGITFETDIRLNDTTFRFAFLPTQALDSLVEKKSFNATISTELFDKVYGKVGHDFVNQFDYYVSK